MTDAAAAAAGGVEADVGWLADAEVGVFALLDVVVVAESSSESSVM